MPDQISSSPDPPLSTNAAPPPNGASVGPPLRDVSLHDQARIEKLTVIGQARYVVIHDRRQVSWPHRIGVVPPLAECYQPRSDPKVDLGREIGSGGPVRTVGVTQVLTGLGGIGKTQLAAAYSRQLWDACELDLLVWIIAANRDAILTGYAQAGADMTGPPEVETAEQVAGRFLNWLTITDRRWLVVLDDLADPADLAGWWPIGPAGQVVVTTQRRDASLSTQGRIRVEVGLFTAEEALAYLAARLRAEQLDGAADLAEDLGRLPLALAQAASYILDRGLDCAGYRHRLAKRRLELALPADAAADDYRATVAATWSLSIERADELAPVGLARSVLQLAALLDSHGIPVGVFTAPSARTYLADAQTGAAADSGTRDEQVEPDDVADALHNLHRLSLVTLTESGPAGLVRVHGLVQRAVREHFSVEALESAASAAADSILKIWPRADYEPELRVVAQSLRNNTDMLLAHCPAVLWTPDGAHPLLLRAGHSRADSGLLHQEIGYFEQLANTAQRVLGPDHRHTLSLRNNLAYVYQLAGRLGEAIPLCERTLADRERVLGSDHPDILDSRGTLAGVYESAGRLSEAIPLYERTLADRERV